MRIAPLRPVLRFAAIPAVLTALFLTGPAAIAGAVSDALLDQAAAEIKAGNLIDAETTLTPRLGKRPDPAALKLMSEVRVGQMRYEEALEFAERAVKADSGKAEYFTQLGTALTLRCERLEQFERDQVAGRIRKAYEKALALDPQCLPALLELCRFHRTMPSVVGASLEKAEGYANRVRQIDAGAGELELAAIDQARKNLTGAIAHYEAAAKLKPGDALLHSEWGRCLFQLGRKEEAKAQLNEALRIDPKLEAVRKILDALEKPEPPKS